MSEPKPLLDLANEGPRPFPKSVPIDVGKAALTALGNPSLADKKVAFVLTPTIERTADGFQLQVREAVVLNLKDGWSFAQFTEWQPRPGQDVFRAGFEIRKVL